MEVDVDDPTTNVRDVAPGVFVMTGRSWPMACTYVIGTGPVWINSIDPICKENGQLKHIHVRHACNDPTSLSLSERAGSCSYHPRACLALVPWPYFLFPSDAKTVSFFSLEIIQVLYRQLVHLRIFGSHLHTRFIQNFCVSAHNKTRCCIFVLVSKII